MKNERQSHIKCCRTSPSSSHKKFPMYHSTINSILFIFLNSFCSVNSSSTTYRNVYGDELQRCSLSNSNMALTGYTRSGSCIDYDDDTGSHHICIDISSTDQNFCDVTGQQDWCSSYLPCDTDDDDNTDDTTTSSNCPVQNWCVCQWAFASYISTAGGCDYIQEIQCDAINLQALSAYSSLAGTYKDENGKYTNALKCIEERCGIEDSSQILEKFHMNNVQRNTHSIVMKEVSPFLTGILVAAVIVAGIIYVKKIKMSRYILEESHENHLNSAPSSTYVNIS